MPRSSLGWAWAGLGLTLALLVQARLLDPLDGALMQALAALRPAGAAEPLNWLFRLGYAPLDAGVALLAAAYLGLRTRSLRLAALPLLLGVVVLLQTGLRLAVDRPSPVATFARARQYASQPAVRQLDQADAVVRGVFVASTGAGSADAQGRGSYPSGHAARLAFLGLLGYRGLSSQLRVGRARAVAAAVLLTLAALVGYSTLYFGYHWPSDVLGGYLLGLAVAELGRQALLIGRVSPRQPSSQQAAHHSVG